MGWITYITMGLMTPLAVGGAYGAFRDSNIARIVGRGELLVLIPLATTGLASWSWSYYCISRCPLSFLCKDAGRNGLIVGAVAGAIIGVVIDVGLLINWIAN